MSGLYNSAGARLTIVAAILIALQAFTLNAQEAPAVSPPYAQFTNSTLTSSVNTINASWVPVVTSTGTTYQNVTIVFNVDASGNLTIAPGYPKIVPAPSIIVSNFKAGNYVGPSTVYSGGMLVNVSGPGVTKGGATEWSLAAARCKPVYLPDKRHLVRRDANEQSALSTHKGRRYHFNSLELRHRWK